MQKEQPGALPIGESMPSTQQHESAKKQLDVSTVSTVQDMRELMRSSTHLTELIGVDIMLPAHYVLHRHILQGTAITQNIRARLRGFIMLEASKQWVMRETAALACTYIDLYFLRKGYCEVQDFQTMAISCLILAMKQQEGKFPTISFSIFSREELLAWERKVAKKLEYRLSPPTYYTFAEHVVVKWDLFTSREEGQRGRWVQCGGASNLVLRRFYEQLDCIFMVVETLGWELELLVVNLFYLHARMLSTAQIFETHQLSSQEFVKVNYSANDKFKLFFQQFLQAYSDTKKIVLNPNLGTFLRHFLSMQPSTKEWAFKKNMECYDRLRIWDKLQTCPKDSYLLAKSVMEKLNPAVKSKAPSKKK